MDRHAPPPPPPEMAAGGDRLSKLDDEVLGHILSFLPAREAARASSLSSRWRHVFAAVHTVSMAETDADHPPSAATSARRTAAASTPRAAGLPPSSPLRSSRATAAAAIAPSAARPAST